MTERCSAVLRRLIAAGSGWKMDNPQSRGDPRDLVNGCGIRVDNNRDYTHGVHRVENLQAPGNVPDDHGSFPGSRCPRLLSQYSWLGARRLRLRSRLRSRLL